MENMSETENPEPIRRSESIFKIVDETNVTFQSGMSPVRRGEKCSPCGCIHHPPGTGTHPPLGKGDLVMADAGYGTAHNYIYAQEQQADVIMRITPKTFCLYDADGEKISLVSLLKQAQEQGEWMVDVFGFCRYKDKTGFVRVVAQKLSEQQAEKSRKRRQRKASKNQNTITQDTLF